MCIKINCAYTMPIMIDIWPHYMYILFNAEFRINGHWRQVQVHPKLTPSKAQPYQHCDHNRSCAKSKSLHC